MPNFFSCAARPAISTTTTVVGRILVGLDVTRAAAVGVPPKHPDRMLRVRVLSDLPASERPSIEVLDTRSAEFDRLIALARRAHGSDFSVCDVSVPVQAHGI